MFLGSGMDEVRMGWDDWDGRLGYVCERKGFGYDVVTGDRGKEGSWGYEMSIITITWGVLCWYWVLVD